MDAKLRAAIDGLATDMNEMLETATLIHGEKFECAMLTVLDLDAMAMLIASTIRNDLRAEALPRLLDTCATVAARTVELAELTEAQSDALMRLSTVIRDKRRAVLGTLATGGDDA